MITFKIIFKIKQFKIIKIVIKLIITLLNKEIFFYKIKINKKRKDC